MTEPNRFAERTRIVDLELSRHTVRITHPDGRLRGTGFFVAPGYVFTAAHVTFADGVPLSVVRVVPSESGVGTEPARATVVARSAGPDGAAIWPFPDVAVLELQPDADWVLSHPCVWLAERDPSGQCHAFGYPLRERGVEPKGGPARFQYEGRTQDRYLQLASGQAIEGLSGAPLVCLTQRGVVGIMAATRDQTQALGGWAAPVFDLAADLPGVPRDLSDWYRTIEGKNREAVLRDRAQWHRVLPIDGAERALRQPWGTFHRGRRTLPTEMLLADSGVVPHLFHEDVLEETRGWCDRPNELGLRHFTGPGGAGKTRWAIELCKTMARRGWITGFWSGRDINLDVVDIPLPRLIVLDYVETLAPQELGDILELLRKRATALAPVRVVLLTRTASGGRGPDVWQQVSDVADAELRHVLGDAPDPVVVGGLSLDQRARLYEEAYRKFLLAWHQEESGDVRVPNLAAERYTVPLEVLLEAFDRALSGGAASSVRSPVDRVLVHEQRHWPEGRLGLGEADRRLAVALATLAGADDEQAADNLLTLMPILAGPGNKRSRSATVQWLQGLYGGEQLINPVRPDRLGEALVASVLVDEEDDGHELLSRVLLLPDDRQLGRCLDVLARLVATDSAMLRVVAAVLFECHPALAERATRQAKGAAGRPGSLDIALGLQRMYSPTLADELTRLASAADDGTALLKLALSFNRTGDLAAQSGRSYLATDLYLRALTIRARLWMGRHSDRDLTRELSISFSRLGDVTLRTGQSKEAKKFYERSRRLRSWLVWEEPTSLLYARDLAIAYDKCAAALGEEGPAEEYYRRSLEIRERLVRESPRNPKFSRDLAVSYDKLGDLENQRGLLTMARRYFEQGMEIRERLRRVNPADTVVSRSLSNSYDRLGDWEFDVEELAAARAGYERAREIRQGLFDAEPGNRLLARDLAQSYNRLGTVARDNAEAARLFTEGLERIQRLADAEPQDTNLGRDMSVFIMSLGDVAQKDGRVQEAEAFFRRGLDGAQRLLALEPDNITFARDVATFYAGLGSLVGEPKAETLLSAAVHFRRHVHERRPDRVDLAEELGYALMRLAQVARPDSAGRLVGETIDLLQPYAAEGRLRRLGDEVWDEAWIMRDQDNT